MAGITDVAGYILQKSGNMPVMKLQMLCYYAQAWTLAWEEVPLFAEDFQAWEYCPVCRVLFERCDGKFVVSSDDFSLFPEKSVLTEIQRKSIDKVLAFYGEKDSHWLGELTRRERPWKEARRRANALPGEACTEIITKQSIADYYTGL